MSRKQPRSAKQSPAVAGNGGPEGAAADHLAKGRFREAIEGYKGLLKHERREEWVAALAVAYAGRAQALADKGMRREAIALWHNRADICGTPLWDGPYVEWVLAEGKLAQALKYLSARHTAGAPEAELAAMEARLAPFILAADDGDAGVIAELPATSPLLHQRPAARAALAAYDANDPVALDAALAGIPFRSPYRDLRPILKAMALLATDAPAGREACRRLPVAGPFERLAAPLRIFALPNAERLRATVKLDLAQQRLVFDLWGCPEPLVPLLRALAGTDDAATPGALLDLVLRHLRALPAAVAGRLWRRLAPWSPRRIDESLRLLGNHPPGALECVLALADEIAGDPHLAERHWTYAAKRLAASDAADDRLRAALILRHMALGSGHLSRDGMLDADGADMLTQSLEFDVYDRDVHVRLVEFWRRDGNLKRARVRLDMALVYFPDDTAVLAEAVATALAGGAFKKAASWARRLLELDPLNPRVRSLVGNAHLSHAGKQIAAGKPEAARKEIAEAAAWLESAAERGRIEALGAWTEPAGSPERTRQAQAALACWGGGLAAGWRLLREAQSIFPRGDPLRVLLDVGDAATQPVALADVLALVPALEAAEYRERKGLDPLRPWRKAIEKVAAAPALAMTDAIGLCEAFGRHREHGLVEKFATAARRRWPQQPIFVYHAVAARFDKRGCIATDRDFDDLEEAYRRARQDNDRRLTTRIDALFEADNPPPAPGGPGLPFPLAAMDGLHLREMIEMAIKIGGEQSFLDQARKDLGNEHFRQIEQECGGNRAAFLRRLIDQIVDVMAGRIGIPPPFLPAKIVKPKKPAKDQGNLFDD